jgi:AcrR family transcriptional regulator
MNNKERLVDIAITLFNAQSASVVSTNRIAAEAGISPGNLYFHFRNKEEIIRAIYARMSNCWDKIFTLPTDRMLALEDLQTLTRSHFEVLWHYRFFYREQGALLKRDPLLKSLYQERRRQGLQNLIMLLRVFEFSHIMRLPEEDTGVHELADLIWLVVDFWLPYIENHDNQVLEEQLENGVKLLFRLIDPYLMK